MASPEKNSKRISQSSENLPEDLPDPDALRRELTELAQGLCAHKTSDALCLFLKVHSCIFERIAASSFPHMIALNPLFARKFISVCRDFQGSGKFAHGRRLWIHALNFYMEHPADIVRT